MLTYATYAWGWPQVMAIYFDDMQAVERLMLVLTAHDSSQVCWLMLTYAGVCWRMLAYADVCWRMLTYADVC